MARYNYGDFVTEQRNFWQKTANIYLDAGVPDKEYFQRLLNKAAYWQQQYDNYVAHLRAINSSFHLAE